MATAEIDPFLLKKWERLFNMFFDRNNSQAVDWGDFYVVAKHVRDIYGAQSEQMKMAKSSMKALWDGLLTVGDKNSDEKISVDEWIEVLKTTSNNKEVKWFQQYLDFMFKLMDVSGDNKLDIAEYTDGMVCYGFSSSDAHAAFAKFALDKNGKAIDAVSFEQWKKLWHEYFYSTDPNARGNHLFGVFEG